MQDAISFTPWYNYALIKLLDSHIQPNIKIFEYGGGMSTLYYAQKRCEVFTVETNPMWIEKIILLAKQHNLMKKIHIIQCKAHKIAKKVHDFSINFDIIIIDSHHRIQCLEEAKKTKCNMIILDNSERPNLQYANHIMEGFQMKVFSGGGPNRERESEAKIFIRS